MAIAVRPCLPFHNMFSAHLVFADINNHSALPLNQRRKQLERFWATCEAHIPHNLKDSHHSFFDLDNDSLMAGFSDVPGLHDGLDVIHWITRLQKELKINDLDVTFAANLMACGREIDWHTCKGFSEGAGVLYIPDAVYEKQGKVMRSRLAGDALIVAARLLHLGKLTGSPLVASVFRDGHIMGGISALDGINGPTGKLSVTDLSVQVDLLPVAHAHWLRDRQITPYGVVAN